MIAYISACSNLVSSIDHSFEQFIYLYIVKAISLMFYHKQSVQLPVYVKDSLTLHKRAYGLALFDKMSNEECRKSLRF